MFDLVIRGGSVVDADGVREADIAIENGAFAGATVIRDWNMAKTWLHRELTGGAPDGFR